MAESRQSTGRWGEDLAVNFLKKQGYKILARNFHSRWGEIDIVAQEGATLCFVEVKSRYSDRFGSPEEAITPFKLEAIEKTGHFWRTFHPDSPEELRIDAVLIEFEGVKEIKRLELIRNVSI